MAAKRITAFQILNPPEKNNDRTSILQPPHPKCARRSVSMRADYTVDDSGFGSSALINDKSDMCSSATTSIRVTPTHTSSSYRYSVDGSCPVTTWTFTNNKISPMRPGAVWKRPTPIKTETVNYDEAGSVGCKGTLSLSLSDPSTASSFRIGGGDVVIATRSPAFTTPSLSTPKFARSRRELLMQNADVSSPSSVARLPFFILSPQSHSIIGSGSPTRAAQGGAAIVDGREIAENLMTPFEFDNSSAINPNSLLLASTSTPLPPLDGNNFSQHAGPIPSIKVESYSDASAVGTTSSDSYRPNADLIERRSLLPPSSGTPQTPSPIKKAMAEIERRNKSYSSECHFAAADNPQQLVQDLLDSGECGGSLSTTPNRDSMLNFNTTPSKFAPPSSPSVFDCGSPLKMMKTDNVSNQRRFHIDANITHSNGTRDDYAMQPVKDVGNHQLRLPNDAATWMSIACGRTPAQQSLTNQARSFLGMRNTTC